uniref:BLOC-1-related complex subunit 7 n=1 Tax=Globodera pallida TaxID=36090 RepID=A0A183CDN3_GLOPA
MPNPKAVKKVTLEGRTRLPQRVQDIVIELGSAMTSVQQTSGSIDLLVTSIRNLTAADGIMANSAQNLEKIEKQMERLEAQTNGTEQGLQNVAVVTTIFDALEQSGYCTTRKLEDEKAEKEGRPPIKIEQKHEKS